MHHPAPLRWASRPALILALLSSSACSSDDTPAPLSSTNGTTSTNTGGQSTTASGTTGNTGGATTDTATTTTTGSMDTTTTGGATNDVTMAVGGMGGATDDGTLASGGTNAGGGFGMAGAATDTAAGGGSMGGMNNAGGASSGGAVAQAGSGGMGTGGMMTAGDSDAWNPVSDDDGALPDIGPNYSDDYGATSTTRGTVYRFTMNSADSEIYPGLNGSYMRNVDVYIPQQYVDGTAAPFMVVQDGPSYTQRVQRALDNLIAADEAPAVIAILPNNGGGDSIGSQRGLEYDTMDDVYVTWVETELLPAVLSNQEILGDYPNLALTDDPSGRAAMGCSSGAAAAMTMAWFGDDLYRRVLSFSGTFVDQQDPQVTTYTNGAWEYHEHLIAEETPNKPIRIWLQVGENDNGANSSEAGLHNWVLANQRMAEALEAKGYVYQYQFSVGAGHCDGGAIGQTMYSAIEWLWRGFPHDH